MCAVVRGAHGTQGEHRGEEALAVWWVNEERLSEKLELEQNVDGRMGFVGQEGAEGSRGIPGRRPGTTSTFF